MKALVGYTGFVGSNLLRSGCFDALYNSKNISDAFGTEPDVLYFAGIPAEKYLANTAPEKDYAVVENAMRTIERIRPKAIVLLSTVDVYKKPDGVDEASGIETAGLHPYGLNRYRLEEFVAACVSDHVIARLPGLYGVNLKKNFIYDMIRFLPSMLHEKKMDDLNRGYLKAFYQKQNGSFYKLRELNREERGALRRYFEDAGFSALSFTDSRSKFQFYNLSHLYRQLETARVRQIRLFHLAVEPCEARELYRFIFEKEFVNEVSENPPNYDMRTNFGGLFGGERGYLSDKNTVMEDVRGFVQQNLTELEQT